MTTISEWQHRWFGYWRESGKAYVRCPSVHDFVDPSWEPPDGVLSYIACAPIVASTSSMALPCVLCGAGKGSLSSRTDGVWHWLDNLVHYMEAHHVRLPDAFVAHMESQGWAPPILSIQQVQTIRSTLEPPPTE